MPDNELQMLLASMDAMNQSLANATNVAVTQNINAKNREWQSKEAEKTRNFNAKQAELAYERQLEYYDTRLSRQGQVEDMKRAGLNPALMYEGSGSVSSPSVSSASAGGPTGGSSATPAPLQVFSVLEAVMAIQRQKAEIANIEAQTGNIQKQTSWIDTYNSTNIDSMKAGIEQVRSNIQVNEQSVQESLQRVQESLKRMDKMDSEIEVNGALVDLHGSQQVLNESRSAVEKMNAKQIELLLPFIQARQEAEIALTNAKTDEARNSAQSLMYDANLKMLKTLVESKLIDSSYYDSVIDQAHWDVKYKKREYKWKPINDICHNISMLAMGVGSVAHGSGSIMHAKNHVPRDFEESVDTGHFGNRTETIRRRTYN